MFSCSELKHLFTYSPIHFFARLSGNKTKNQKLSLLRVKTPIHLFTYSPFTFIPPFVNFRLVEPKRRWGLHIYQNWACATKRRSAPSLLHFWHDSYSKTMQYGVSGNKMKNGQLFLWLELKQLFTYSPIHFLEIKSKSGQPFLAPS